MNFRRLVRGNRLVRWAWLRPYVIAYDLLRRVRRIRPNSVLFLSDSRASFSGNFEFLRDEIRRQDPRAEIRSLFKPSLSARRPVRDMLRLPLWLAQAQTIVLDDYYPLAAMLTVRPHARMIQVWHAGGAFKRVGYSRAGLPGGPAPGTTIHSTYTDVTVSSETVRPNYAEAFGVDPSVVSALGVPRTDALFDHARVRSAATRIRQRYGIADGARIALFAPTFRGRGQKSATFDFDSVQWERLGEELGPDWVVLVKMHPFVSSLTQARPGIRAVIDVTADREMTDLMMAADVLVTDYSSAIFEFALLERPVIFFCPDLEEYTASRNFYYPFEDYLIGPVVRSTAELITAVRTARVDPRSGSFVERFMGACDGHSSERIVRDLVLSPRRVPMRGGSAAGGGSEPVPTTQQRGSALSILAALVTRTGLGIVSAPLRLLPVQDKVVMASREHNQIPTDFADIAAAVSRANRRVRVRMSVRPVPPGLWGKLGYGFHLIAQLYHVATARVLIVDTYSPVASMVRHRRDLQVIQIWHALGAFKKFGLSILDRPEGRSRELARAWRMHQGYDIVLASSVAARPAFAEAFGVPESRVRVAPLPRADRLRDPVLIDATRERIYARYPDLKDATVALFAPTFRMDGSVSADIGELQQKLEARGITLLVSLHPLMSAPLPRGVMQAPEFSTQELLCAADVLITDYSSIIFEAALRSVPTYFLAPDLDTYRTSRDFYLDYESDLPGPVSPDIAGLVEAIDDRESDQARVTQFADRWVEFPAPTQNPTTACADHIAHIILTAGWPSAAEGPDAPTKPAS